MYVQYNGSVSAKVEHLINNRFANLFLLVPTALRAHKIYTLHVRTYIHQNINLYEE